MVSPLWIKLPALLLESVAPHGPSASKTYKSSVLVGLALASGILAILRFKHAAAPFENDEFASIYFSRQKLSDLWGWWMLRETNPPLFYTLLKLWRAVVPDSYWNMRFLSLLISFIQTALATWLISRRYGGFAPVLCVLLCSYAMIDLDVSRLIRGYGTEKLGITLAFVGLVYALEAPSRRNRFWFCYVLGSVVAIYSHATALLWPLIVFVAVLIDAAITRKISRRLLVEVVIANASILVLASWEVMIAYVQVHDGSSNIAWIVPLTPRKFAASVVQSVFYQGTKDATIVMLALIFALITAGCLLSFRERTTRLSLLILCLGIVVFRMADVIHAISKVYSLHWLSVFVVILASASLGRWKRVSKKSEHLQIASSGLILVAISVLRLPDIGSRVMDYTVSDPAAFVRRVARTPNAALIATEVEAGLFANEACRIEFRSTGCPFRLVVLNRSNSADGFARDSASEPLVETKDALEAVGDVEWVYLYQANHPFQACELGLNFEKYELRGQSDGLLHGPIPAKDLPRPNARSSKVGMILPRVIRCGIDDGMLL